MSVGSLVVRSLDRSAGIHAIYDQLQVVDLCGICVVGGLHPGKHKALIYCWASLGGRWINVASILDKYIVFVRSGWNVMKVKKFKTGPRKHPEDGVIN